MMRYGIFALTLIAVSPLHAEQVTVTGGSVYVTKGDCMALVQHHPSADVTYQPGRDVHGKYVAPADLPGAVGPTLPERIQFDLRVNPLAYGGQPAGPAGAFANTAMPLTHVEVDLATGETKLDGKPLTSAEDQIVVEACRKAGYR